MDKAQVQKSSSKPHGKQNSRTNKTRASKNNHFDRANNSVSFLQQSLGNQAVGRMIQAKLTIGEPDDKYEREADQVADKVMRIPDKDDESTVQKKPIAHQISPLVQRAPEEQMDEDESTLQTMSDGAPIQDEEETIAAKPLLQRQAEPGMDEEEASVQTKPYTQRQANEDDEEPLQAKSIAHQITHLVQRATDEQLSEEESTVQAMSNGAPIQDEEETIATKPLLQRQTESGMDEEEAVQTKPYIQREEAGKEEESVQMKPILGSSLHESKVDHTPTHSVTPFIQRVCTECEEEVQRQPEEKEELAQKKPLGNQQNVSKKTLIQPRGVRGRAPQVSSVTAANIHSLKSGGSRLPRSTQSFFESRFGADFNQVRVHTGSRADETAKSINARAFTVGKNIAFGAGQYSPESQAGKRLLGHELTHVVQQTKHQEIQRQPAESPPTPYNYPGAEVSADPIRLIADGLVKEINRNPTSGRARRRFLKLSSDQRATVDRILEQALNDNRYIQFNESLSKPPPPEEAPSVPVITEEAAPYEGASGDELQEDAGESASSKEDVEKELSSVVESESETVGVPEPAETQANPGAEGEQITPEKSSSMSSEEAMPISAKEGGVTLPLLGAVQSVTPVLQVPSSPLTDINLEAEENTAIFDPEGAVGHAAARKQNVNATISTNLQQLEVSFALANQEILANTQIQIERVQQNANQSRVFVQSHFGDLQQQVQGLSDATKLEIQRTLILFRQMVATKETEQTQTLITTYQSIIDRITNGNQLYDETANLLADRESARSQNGTNSKVAEVQAIGSRRKSAATGDSELRQMKREGIQEISSNTIDHMSDTSNETDHALHEMASEVQGKFGEEAQKLIEQLQSTHNQALVKIPQFSSAVLERISSLEQKIMPQIDELTGKMISAVQEQREQALTNIQQGELEKIQEINQSQQQISESLTAYHQQLVGHLQMIQGDYNAAVDGAEKPDESLVDATSSHVEGMVDQALSAGIDVYSQTTTEYKNALQQVGNAFINGLNEMRSATLSQSQTTLAQISSSFVELQQTAISSIEQEHQGFEDNLVQVVTDTILVYEELATSFEQEVDKALAELETKMVLAADESMLHNQEEINALEGSGKLTEVERRAEEEYNKSWWESFVYAFLKGLLIGLLVLVLVAVVLVAIVGAKIALIIGLVILAGLTLYTIYSRAKALWESGASWEQWLLFVTVGVPTGVLDAIGVTPFLEGLVGYDFYTWRELSAEEAGTRAGAGLAGIVVTVISLGLAKATAPRGATPSGARGGPGAGRGGASVGEPMPGGGRGFTPRVIEGGGGRGDGGPRVSGRGAAFEGTGARKLAPVIQPEVPPPIRLVPPPEPVPAAGLSSTPGTGTATGISPGATLVPGAAAATASQRKKKQKKQKLLYRWQVPHLYQGRNGRLTYSGATRPSVNYQSQGHHVWPITLGGDPSQVLLTIIHTIHNEEIHYGRNPVGSPVIATTGSIYNYVTNYINSNKTFGPTGINVLQGRRLTHPGGTTSGNPLLIARMQQGDTTAHRLAGTVRNAMTLYYALFQGNSSPQIPYNSYRQGLDDSYTFII